MVVYILISLVVLNTILNILRRFILAAAQYVTRAKLRRTPCFSLDSAKNVLRVRLGPDDFPLSLSCCLRFSPLLRKGSSTLHHVRHEEDEFEFVRKADEGHFGELNRT